MRIPVFPLSDRWDAFVLLTRTFFTRLFDTELLSPRGGTPPALWIAAFVATPGLTRTMHLYTTFLWVAGMPLEQRVVATWPHKLFFINWSMAATGFVTVLAWEALLPDRRDCLIMDALPMPRRTAAAARAAALLLFFLAMLIATNAFATLLFPTIVMESKPPVSWLPYVFAHAIAMTAAGAFVFAGILLLQLLLANSVDPRWFRRTATLAQCASVVIVLLLFLLPPPAPIRAWVSGEASVAWMSWLPPFWFLGLYETLLGTHEPILRDAASRGLIALGVVTAGAALLYALTYGRHVRRMIESPEGGRGSMRSRAWIVAQRILGRWARGPIERGVFDFVLASLARSPRPRLMVSAYAGAGVAGVLASAIPAWLQSARISTWPPTIAWLAMPLVLSFFLLVGMRASFGTPTDLAANWCFRVTESADRRQYIAGVRKAMLLIGGVVPAACLLPLYWSTVGATAAIAHAWFCLLMARALIVVLTWRFPRIPYAYLPLPGGANVKAWWPVYLAGFGAYAYASVAWERPWLSSASGIATFLAAAFVLELALRFVPGWARMRKGAFVFEDEPEQPVQLHLSRVA